MQMPSVSAFLFFMFIRLMTCNAADLFGALEGQYTGKMSVSQQNDDIETAALIDENIEVYIHATSSLQLSVGPIKKPKIKAPGYWTLDPYLRWHLSLGAKKFFIQNRVPIGNRVVVAFEAQKKTGSIEVCQFDFIAGELIGLTIRKFREKEELIKIIWITDLVRTSSEFVPLRESLRKRIYNS